MTEIGIGHNQPDMTEAAQSTATDLSAWMADNPVIETEETAKEAKVYIDRGSLCIKDLEDERDNKVRPLNEQVRSINDHYRGPRGLLQKVLDELKLRMDGFLLAEERKRIEAAEAARKLVEEARQKALEAERLEREAIDSASQGELGVDVATVTAQADTAFAEYKKAERQSVIADRDTRVKIGGGFTRALSLKATEILEVTDLIAAVTAMKDSERIIESVIKAARSYKKVFGKYPPGIGVRVERGI